MAAAAKAWNGPLEKLQEIVRAAAPQNEDAFVNWVTGSYEHRGAARAMRDRVAAEAHYGTAMDLDKINKQFYDDVRLGVQKYTAGQTNEWQAAAIKAELEKIQRGIQPDDVFPEKQ